MKRLLFLVIFTIAAYVTVLTCIVSCANTGSGPDGGPYDETPPRIVGMTPPTQVASGVATGKKKKKNQSTKFSLLFSELVTIENATENVIVSPPQIEMPNIQAAGRRINVELLDSLKPNTTYTIDFSDAIKDSNEGNPLGHFTYIFSTGEVTDTMEMSGYVLNAEDLEPISGILVGLHPCPEGMNELNLMELWSADTLFTKTPFNRVARTDASGYFSVKGVSADRQYLAYALKDGDGDFAFSQRSEQIAFNPRILKPGAFADTRYDTLWIDSTRYDSIRVRPYTHYTPDDIMLLAFQEANQPRYMLKNDRSSFENFKIWFSAPSKHVPVIHGLNFDATNAFVEQRSVGNDTLVYWLRDTLLMQQDTLLFTYDFMAWDDSLQLHRLTTDTLQLTSKTPWKKRLAEREKEEEKWQKALERRHKRGDFSQEEKPLEFLKMNCSASATLAPNQNVMLTFDVPIESIDMEGVHLDLIVDSVATPAPFLMEPVADNIMARQIMAEWRPEQKYQLVIDSAAVHNIYGLHNTSMKREFTIDKLDKFGTYFLAISNLPEETKKNLEALDSLENLDNLETLDSLEALDSLENLAPLAPEREIIVQLLDRGGKVVYTVNAVKLSPTSARAEFYYLKEGEYYVRCIVDDNANGRWDPGEWSSRRAPEDVFYRRESTNVRAGWDVNEDWNVTALSRHQQKPEALVKQKKTEKGKNSAHERNIKRLEERLHGPQNNGSKSSTGVAGLRF